MSPLRVTIEIVPGGDEAYAQVIDRVVITQKADQDRSDPGGERDYTVVSKAPGGSACVAHNRSDGARVLVRKALEALEVKENRDG